MHYARHNAMLKIMRLTALLAALCMTVIGGTAQAQQAFNIPRLPVERHTLPNGLTVLLSRDTAVRVVTVDVWYHVGSRNETAGRTGFAHLFEHVMFQGTKHIPNGQHARIVEEAGGDMNGSTASDRTNYFETVPSNRLETGLWLESDRMGFLLDSLDQSKLDAQRGVVKNERRQRVDNQVYGSASEVMSAALFPPSNPYSWPTIGSMRDLDAATLGDVKQFFRANYSPSNATLAIVGDFDPAKAMSLVTKYFGPIPAGQKVVQPTVAPVTLPSEKRIVLEDTKATLPRLMIAWPTVSNHSPDDEALSALAEVLIHDRTSRLTKLLVYDRQLATQVMAWQSGMDGAGEFSITVLPRPGASLTVIEHLIDSTLTSLATDAPPTESEITRYKSQETLSLVLELESAMRKAETLLQGQVFDGDPLAYVRETEQSLAVKPSDVTRVLQKYLTHGRVVLSMVPAGKLGLAADTTRAYVIATPGEAPTAASSATTAANAAASAPTGSIRETPETFDRTVAPHPDGDASLAFPAIQMRTLSNGIRVAVLEDHRTPVVQGDAVIDIPGTADPAGKTGLSDVVMRMLGEATKSRSAAQIADARSALGNYTSATGFLVTTQNVDSALALMGDELRNPAFPEAALQRIEANQIAQLVRQNDDAQYLADRVLSNVLYGAGHAYARSTTAAEIRSMTRDDVERFYQTYVRPPNIQFVIAGDITPDQAVARLQHYFGNWKAGTRARVTPPPPRAPRATAIYLYDRPGSAQSVILVGAPGPRRDAPDHYATQLMNTALGGAFNSRLNLDLRERRHFTYGASSEFEFRRPPESGVFRAGAAVEAQKTDSAVLAFMKDIGDVGGNKPITPTELEFARSASVKRLPLQFETTLAREGAVNTLLSDDLNLQYYQTLVPNLKRVTSADAARAGKAHLDADHMAIVVVGDRKVIEPGLRALGLAPVVIVPPLSPAQPQIQ
jgi:zinc protease